MKRVIGLLPIIALALLTASAVVRAEEENPGDQAYAALASYFDGEISRDEADAAIDEFLAPRENETQGDTDRTSGTPQAGAGTPSSASLRARELYWETIGVCDAVRNGEANPHYNQILCDQYRQDQAWQAELAARLAEWQANPPTPHCEYAISWDAEGNPIQTLLHAVPNLTTGEYVVTPVVETPGNTPLNCTSTTPGNVTRY